MMPLSAEHTNFHSRQHRCTTPLELAAFAGVPDDRRWFVKASLKVQQLL